MLLPISEVRWIVKCAGRSIEVRNKKTVDAKVSAYVSFNQNI